MSSEAVASVFRNLDPSTFALINEIKTFLDSHQFTNQGNAEEYAQIAVETAVHEVTDGDGVVWAGPDHRNAIVTPYFSPHENLEETIKVLVALVFTDEALEVEESVSITINEFEEYNILQDCSWVDVRGRILSLMGDGLFQDDAPPMDDGDHGNTETARMVKQQILDLIKDDPFDKDAIEIPFLNDVDEIIPQSPAVDSCAGVVDLDFNLARTFKRQKV